MIEHNCRCPGCGECDAHLRERIAQPKKHTTPPGNANVIRAQLAEKNGEHPWSLAAITEVVNEAVAAEREACAALCEKIGYAYREEYDRVKNHGATGREAAGESLASAVTAIELGRVVRRRGKQ